MPRMPKAPKIPAESPVRKIEKAPKAIQMKVDRIQDLERLNPIIKEMLEDAVKVDKSGTLEFSLDFSLSF